LPIDSMVVDCHSQLEIEAYPNLDFGLEELDLLYSLPRSFPYVLAGISIEARKMFEKTVESRTSAPRFVGLGLFTGLA